MLKNIKIRSRMLLSYAVVIILSLSGSIVSLGMLSRVGDNLQTFYDNNYTVTVQAWTARWAIQAAQADILGSVMETDLTLTQEKVESAQENINAIRATFPVIRETYRGDLAQVDQAEKILDDALPYRNQILELSQKNQNEEAFKILKEEYVPRQEQIVGLLTQISNEAGENAKKMVDNGRAAQSTAELMVMVIAGASVMLAIIIGVRMANGIRKPIVEIQNASRDLAAGKLDTVIHYQARDELGQLAENMRETVKALETYIKDLSKGMKGLENGDLTVTTDVEYQGEFITLKENISSVLDTLNDTLGQINQAADQVAGGSEQVSSGAQALSQGATEQASSVEELAATINEISEQVKGNAANAVEAGRVAQTVGDKMVESNRQMQEMIQAMDSISATSSEIGKIIKTIEDIAFQTNILALNAAVEAARAGAAGKGFAVVADEVRNLASKSAEASKDTAELIENALDAVKNGAKIADETAKSMMEAVDGAGVVVETVNKISGASEAQANSITQVTMGVDQISFVVQTNSATAEQSAAASEELSGQAQMLKSLVGRFRLRSSSITQQSAFPDQYSGPSNDKGNIRAPYESGESQIHTAL